MGYILCEFYNICLFAKTIYFMSVLTCVHIHSFTLNLIKFIQIHFNLKVDCVLCWQSMSHNQRQAMEGVRTFLESSTIHGLAYISISQKYARLFWILVVLTGFIGASLLIKGRV